MVRCRWPMVGTLVITGALAPMLQGAVQPAPADLPPPGGVAAQPPASGQPAPPGEPEAMLYLKDGRVFTGIMVERNDERVVLKIAGIRTPFNASEVDRIKVLPPVVERYRDMRRNVDDTDVDGILSLIDWLVSRNELDTALAETLELRQRFANNGAVQRHEMQIRRAIELRSKAGQPVKTEPRPPTVPEGPAVAAVPLLGIDQINLIKVFEVDLSHPPQMVVPREMVGALLDKYAGHPLVPATREGRDAIARRAPPEFLDLMFRLKAREFYPQVRVVDLPESMRRFRDDVHRPVVMNYCATNACHGGTDAGRLVLASQRPNSDPTVFTNFFILSHFVTSQGQSLIDWDKPERSALFQLGMARDISTARHPVVVRGGVAGDAWKPLFRSGADRRFIQAVGWVDAMYRPRPDYGIEYKPLRPLAPSPPPPDKPGANR